MGEFIIFSSRCNLPKVTFATIMSSLASLKFSKQTSLSVDRFSDNGVEKNLHYVIKNAEFSVVMELPESIGQHSFDDLLLESHLLYDCAPEPKEVLQLKQQPFKYKGTVDPDNSRSCIVQASISILSSQHEDMNFVLKFVANDRENGEPVVVGYSEPIQVISKPDVLRKKRQPKAKKRTWNDRITETLERMEAKQEELLKQFAEQKDVRCISPSSSPALVHDQTPTPSPSENFESAFYHLVQAYKNLSADERPSKIRKLFQTPTADLTTADLVFNLHTSAQENYGFQNSLSPEPAPLPWRGGGCKIENPAGYCAVDSPSDFDLDTLVDTFFSS